jgi:hypothetical protein
MDLAGVDCAMGDDRAGMGFMVPGLGGEFDISRRVGSAHIWRCAIVYPFSPLNSPKKKNYRFS